jgi:hypothetical protein
MAEAKGDSSSALVREVYLVVLERKRLCWLL